METVRQVFHIIEAAVILLFDIACAGIIVAGSVVSLYKLFRHKHHIVLTMARYINVALLFKLSGEVVRLISVRTFKEMGLVACIVVIHGSISFLINWEVRREEKRRDSPEKKTDIGEDIFL